ncbi:MAG: D-glycero-beta-D-manno-heptose 1-phosphate adenylyltransferase [Chitinophagaceae bacterium]|nr:MAG: D-glycero-beta-D-manno-heptose 1-phosphate adenylyltransferase [Chitinophagaceae bacterium]
MRQPEKIDLKIYELKSLLQCVAKWRLLGKTVGFTNGCFDILHKGHIFSLSEAAKEVDYLIVAINSDNSVKKLKGPDRPINAEQTRALIVASLLMVDAVIIFDEENPLELIKLIQPDVLIKGNDYTLDKIAGAKEVIAAGGKVVLNPILENYSTTNIIEQATK